MKTTKIIALSLALIAFAFSANAQYTEVLVNQTSSATVTPNPLTAVFDYTWSVTGGTSTNLTLDTDNSVNILWDGAVGIDYTLSVYATDAVTTCSGDIRSAVYRIVNTLSYEVSIPVAPSAVCPQTTSNPTGGSGAFDVAVTGTTVLAGETLTVRYNVDGVAQAPVTFAAGLQGGTIPVPGLTNATTADITVNVEVTSALISGRPGVTFPVGHVTDDITVHAAPQISDIF
jgi:hypothetical protein